MGFSGEKEKGNAFSTGRNREGETGRKGSDFSRVWRGKRDGLSVDYAAGAGNDSDGGVRVDDRSVSKERYLGVEIRVLVEAGKGEGRDEVRRQEKEGEEEKEDGHGRRKMLGFWYLKLGYFERKRRGRGRGRGVLNRVARGTEK